MKRQCGGGDIGEARYFLNTHPNPLFLLLMEVEMKRQRGGGDTGEAGESLPVLDTYLSPCPICRWRWR